jgi:hypothetical protein
MTRIPFGKTFIDPTRRNIFIDSCVFDTDMENEKIAAMQLLDLFEKEIIYLQLAHSTKNEISHPSTPGFKNLLANQMVYSIKTQRTQEQQKEKLLIYKILTGNSKKEKMKMDAENVFEASIYCAFFVTTDKRIIKKRNELQKVGSAIIVKPSELINKINQAINA